MALLECAASASEKWGQEVYVWQRQWTPEVAASLRTLAPITAAFHVLAAEVSWRKGGQHVFFTPIDYAVLKREGVRVGLTVRIGPYDGVYSRADATADRLGEVVADVLARARANAVEPIELQIDFDCAETKLAGYREWLEAIRKRIGPLRLVFTALPAWLRHGEAFRALAQMADGFVLQVHSQEKPSGAKTAWTICDPVRARGWIETAGRMGAPFRIALPTYGYEVGFDAAGKFIGLAAEGPGRVWPEGTRVEIVRTDVEAMHALARDLGSKPPANCEGVIWFRLPVEGDRLNWDIRTLAAVMRSERLEARLLTDVTWSATDAGLAEVFIENGGNRSLPLPARVNARWSAEARPRSADSLAGYTLTPNTAAGRADFSLAPAQRPAVLPPGRRLRVGWMRFPHELSLQIEIPSGPPDV